MVLITSAPSPPVVIHLVSSGPSWLALMLSLLGTFLVGMATAVLIQFWVVPKVEARKRREDRWEHDVRDLGELLTTSLGDRAQEAFVEQSAFRHVLQLERAVDADKDRVATLKGEYSLKARQATAAFDDLAHSRVPWLVDRVKSVDPASDAIVKFVTAARHHRIRAMALGEWSGDYAPPDPTFDEAWDQERDARRALVTQVTALLDLPHPPRASLRRRWSLRRRRRNGLLRSAKPQDLTVQHPTPP